MPSEITEPQASRSLNAPRVTIPTEILLSLATGPLLVGILAAKASLEFLQSVGSASEEVFRGASLPLLDFPDNQPK
ncbi:MAG TPA: hypothetical protein DDW76_09820 [Cyanobacteria bacterium UBA11369]|nr:hypothetical protein [Cyanobacteria bacterium UBA11371]HBE33254.1 hypothetical protein [Cyanobacteria bacterium UBA11368]HBE49070.1 hypothetical protein [Cyanobacteria bacterium UBA11369]